MSSKTAIIILSIIVILMSVAFVAMYLSQPDNEVRQPTEQEVVPEKAVKSEQEKRQENIRQKIEDIKEQYQATGDEAEFRRNYENILEEELRKPTDQVATKTVQEIAEKREVIERRAKELEEMLRKK